MDSRHFDIDGLYDGPEAYDFEDEEDEGIHFCPECDGDGVSPETFERCEHCGGDGGDPAHW